MRPVSALRVAFAGTPEFALPTLEAIAASGHRLVAVFSQPDRGRGRGRRTTPSPVAARAQAMGLAVHKPPRFDDQAVGRLRDCGADVLVVVAYGLILPAAALAAPPHGAINVHASLLPRWRGAAPVARAIEAGDTATGVTIMQMDEGLDTGGVIDAHAVAIDWRDDAGSLAARLARIGAQRCVAVLDRMAGGRVAARPQQAAGACYARKLDKAEARIDWSADALAIARRIRAFSPWPVCWCEADGAMLRIHAARCTPIRDRAEPGSLRDDGRRVLVRCGDGWLELLRVQRAGGRAMDARDWRNGPGRDVRRLG